MEKVGTLSFNMTSEQKERLIESGMNATVEHLEKSQIDSRKKAEILPGLNIEGKCSSNQCSLYEKKVTQNIGTGNYLLSDIVFDANCLNCNAPFKADKIIFEKCSYTIEANEKSSRKTRVENEKISGSVQHSFNINDWFSAKINVT